MPKKDTRTAVLAMLSNAGAENRPVVGATTLRRRGSGGPELEGEPDTDPTPAEAWIDDTTQVLGEDSTAISNVRASNTANGVDGSATVNRAVQRRGARRSKPRGSPGSEGASLNAPRTLRLSQPVANELRAAWLEARKAGDVLLTQQDHARRVISRGLKLIPNTTTRRMMGQEGSSDEESARAPLTLRLDQATANELRAGWLDARRAGDLLLPHTAYSDQVVLAGLPAGRRRSAASRTDPSAG